VLTEGTLTVGVWTVGVLTVGVLTDGTLTVGTLTVGREEDSAGGTAIAAIAPSTAAPAAAMSNFLPLDTRDLSLPRLIVVRAPPQTDRR
jgi:hypothetical protein